MVQLVETLELKTRMGAPLDLAGLDNSLVTSIMSAQLRVEGILDSPLSMGTSTDVFRLDNALQGGVIADGLFRLRLRRAFVHTITSIKFGNSSTTIDTEFPDGTTYLRDDNLVRGYVSVDGTYDGLWVSVEYDAGFDDTNKASAPAWLKEAILCLAIAGIKSSPVQSSSAKDNMGDPAIRFYEAMANDVMMPYHRRLGLSMKPVY